VTTEKNSNSWIGTDESGKGDYFGPLVIAGIYTDDIISKYLRDLGVRDSKNLTDKRVLELSRKIRLKTVHSIVVIGPQKYNELQAKMKTLNRLLAWGHARAIENILLRVECNRAITDQFGDEKFVLEALLKMGKRIKLEQRPRAESDMGVAAASILARARFLLSLEELSRVVGMSLPKGASNEVEAVARKIVGQYGINALQRIAKVHFKTTERVINIKRENNQNRPMGGPY
jgi:ribonuclease HIII